MSLRLKRSIMWGLNGVAGLLVLLTAALVVAERHWASPRYRSPAEAFHEGTIGTEFAPLAVLQALPVVFPELFPPGGPDGDWIERYGFVRGGPFGLPYGLTVSNYRPRNAAPSPVPFVGIGCAACHVAEVLRADGSRVRVPGMGNASLDLIVFFEAFRDAVLRRDEDGQPVLTLAKVRDSADPALGPAGTAIVWVWLVTARDALERGTERHDLPRSGDALWDSRFNPVGPGRTNPFNTLVTTVLRLPNTSADSARPNLGYARIPPVWAQAQRAWGQFDGSISDLHARSALAALTIGATVENLAHPEIAHNVRAASDYTRDLLPPSFADVFGVEPDPGAVQRGAAVYAEHCATCHGTPAGGVAWTPGNRTGEIIAAGEIGTDPERVLLRHALRLADRLHADFADNYESLYKLPHPLATSRRALRPLSAADTLGYIAQPLPGSGLRAPYLHNGAVPTLAALIHLVPRPTVFYRGRNAYDGDLLGLVTDRHGAATYFRFDAARPGNSAAGHDFPWARDDPRRDPAALADLLEYLKTF